MDIKINLVLTLLLLFYYNKYKFHVSINKDKQY